MVINRVGPLSVGKVAGTLYAAMGVLIGAVVSVIAMAGARMADDGGASPFGALLGVGAIVFFPILYGVMGFLFTMLFAVLYNVVAGIVGGIEVDVQ
jgi:hypothetical protein